MQRASFYDSIEKQFFPLAEEVGFQPVKTLEIRKRGLIKFFLIEKNSKFCCESRFFKFFLMTRCFRVDFPNVGFSIFSLTHDFDPRDANPAI